MRLVVGLGNKDRQYTDTRHNAGFIAVDQICEDNNFSWQNDKMLNANLAKGLLNGSNLLFIKPNTYMNCSGIALQAVSSYYKIDSKDILVIHDDIDLSFCEVKAKFGGGSGGHNGLKSIDQSIGSNYHRLRVGIGRPENSAMSVADYVLSDFTKEELKNIKNAAKVIGEYFHLLIDLQVEDFIRFYKNAKQEKI